VNVAKPHYIGLPYQGTHTLYGNWESDNAVDIALPKGTPVYAVASGRIGSQIGPIGGNDPHMAGQRLHLNIKGNELYYQHLQQIVVKAGQTVKKGQLLGYTGALNHLHLGVRNGKPQAYA
jgi:murein DD-endopeptidase MepM/ murein hydrolase activator NlpD